LKHQVCRQPIGEYSNGSFFKKGLIVVLVDMMKYGSRIRYIFKEESLRVGYEVCYSQVVILLKFLSYDQLSMMANSKSIKLRVYSRVKINIQNTCHYGSPSTERIVGKLSHSSRVTNWCIVTV